MNNAADEVKIKILSYLSLRDLCQVSLVNTGWYSLSHDQSLRSKLDTSHIVNLTDDKLLSLVKRHPNVTHLNTKGGALHISESALYFVIVQCAPYLTHLNLNSCYEVSTDLFSAVLQCIYLQYLDIGDNPNIDDVSLIQLSEAPALSSLVISRCDNISDQGLSVLLSKVSLKLLDASHVLEVRGPSLDMLVKQSSKTLTHLYLDGGNLSDKDLDKISKLVSLTLLEIQYCDEMTDLGLAALAKLPLLCDLRLCRCFNLSSECLSDIVCKLPIRKLTLTDFSLVDDRVLLALARHCNRTLQYLELLQSLCNSISDIGVCAVLSNCSYLQSLVLRGIKSVRNFPVIVPVSNLRYFRRLHLAGCQNVSDYTLRSVTTICHRLHVYGQFATLIKPFDAGCFILGELRQNSFDWDCK